VVSGSPPEPNFNDLRAEPTSSVALTVAGELTCQLQAFLLEFSEPFRFNRQ